MNLKFKVCMHCKTSKRITDFSENRTRQDGHSDWCRQCSWAARQGARYCLCGCSRQVAKRTKETLDQFYARHYATDYCRRQHAATLEAEAGAKLGLVWVGNKGHVPAPNFWDQNVASEVMRPRNFGYIRIDAGERRSLIGNSSEMCSPQ